MLTKISYNPAIYKTNSRIQPKTNKTIDKTAQISFGMLPAQAVSPENIKLLEKIAEKLTKCSQKNSTKAINNKTITLNPIPKKCGEIIIKEKNGSELKINNIFYGDALNLEYFENSKNPTKISMRLAYGKDGKGYEFEPGEILKYKEQHPKKGMTISVERAYFDRSCVNQYFQEEKLNKLNRILSKILQDALL